MIVIVIAIISVIIIM